MLLEALQNSQENTCAWVFFNKAASLQPIALFKKNPVQMFFINTFFIDHLRATVSKYNVTFKELFSLAEF